MQLHKGVLATILATGLLVAWATTSIAASDASPEERCAAAKLRAVGKSVQVRLGCIARGTVSIDFDPDTCLEKASALFAVAFAKAERNDCATVGDAEDWELEIQDFVDGVDASLAP